MSQLTEVNTFDLEPGLVVRISENVYIKVLYIYQDWLDPNYKRINFSNQRYDDAYKNDLLWEVKNVHSCG